MSRVMSYTFMSAFMAMTLVSPLAGCSDGDDDHNSTNTPSQGLTDPPIGGTGEPGGNGGGGDQKPPAGGNQCGSVPSTGVCEGNVVKYCSDGKLGSYDCATEGKVCGAIAGDGGEHFGCKLAGGTGGGSGELVTAEDWARARIAGSVSTEQAFAAIAYSSGFPVVTDDNTVIFMHWYEGGNWSVAGEFNNWEQQSMTQVGDIWYVEVPISGDISKDNKGYYKFVQNNSDYQADPWALSYGFTPDGEISYITKPTDKAHFMRWHNFASPQGLKSRTIRAYVPENSTGVYDVLYAHDGNNLFGPGGEYGSWRVEDAMSELGANFLVVGIDNTSDRFSEYTHVDETIEYGGTMHVQAKGREYAQYVNDSVRPFIESKFKTSSKRGVMGSSLGGLISLYIAYLYPDEYKVALALSPTTAWGRFSNDNGKLIEDLYVEKGPQSPILYLDNGGDEPYGGCGALNSATANGDEANTDNFCFTRHFVDKMAEIGYTWDVNLFHHFEKGALHNEAAWAARLKKPLKIFMDAQ